MVGDKQVWVGLARRPPERERESQADIHNYTKGAYCCKHMYVYVCSTGSCPLPLSLTVVGGLDVCRYPFLPTSPAGWLSVSFGLSVCLSGCPSVLALLRLAGWLAGWLCVCVCVCLTEKPGGGHHHIAAYFLYLLAYA